MRRVCVCVSERSMPITKFQCNCRRNVDNCFQALSDEGNVRFSRDDSRSWPRSYEGPSICSRRSPRAPRLPPAHHRIPIALRTEDEKKRRGRRRENYGFRQNLVLRNAAKLFKANCALSRTSLRQCRSTLPSDVS